MTTTTRPATLPTKLHFYSFDTSKPAEAEAWRELSNTLTARGLECFSAMAFAREASGDRHGKTGTSRDVEIETDFIFDNQWNTTTQRVFDWYLAIFPNRSIQSGHYLDLTPAMLELRATVGKCGYCGAHHEQPWPEFCDRCLDSEYLKPENLPLTRVRAAGDRRPSRPALTDVELSDRMPQYVQAQLHGTTERGRARVTKQRADILAEADRKIAAAQVQRDGLIWLMDHSINIGNVIFYSHTGRFGFGWRTKMDAATVSALLDVITEFPYAYDIECADGRTLSGDR